MRTLTALPLLCLLVGCAHTRTYEVTLKNHADDWLTIGLVKEGGPAQPDWQAPEVAVSNEQTPSAMMWEHVPPGKAADTGQIKGKFFSGSQAILRVYEGKLGLEGMMAISRGQPNRADIELHPGANRFTVTRDGDRLIVERDERVNMMSQQ
ncbi:MAG TPA: hypothetical protein VGI81_22850 [Tepidisphaeraceae bacterium]|jgi:hypothetical protein